MPELELETGYGGNLRKNIPRTFGLLLVTLGFLGDLIPVLQRQ